MGRRAAWKHFGIVLLQWTIATQSLASGLFELLQKELPNNHKSMLSSSMSSLPDEISGAFEIDGLEVHVTIMRNSKDIRPFLTTLKRGIELKDTNGWHIDFTAAAIIIDVEKLKENPPLFSGKFKSEQINVPLSSLNLPQKVQDISDRYRAENCNITLVHNNIKEHNKQFQIETTLLCANPLKLEKFKIVEALESMPQVRFKTIVSKDFGVENVLACFNAILMD